VRPGLLVLKTPNCKDSGLIACLIDWLVGFQDGVAD